MCNGLCNHISLNGAAMYPPETCKHCKETGPIFYRDTERTVTYRCRLCGTEHYEDVIEGPQRELRSQGRRVD